MVNWQSEPRHVELDVPVSGISFLQIFPCLRCVVTAPLSRRLRAPMQSCPLLFVSLHNSRLHKGIARRFSEGSDQRHPTFGSRPGLPSPVDPHTHYPGGDSHRTAAPPAQLAEDSCLATDASFTASCEHSRHSCKTLLTLSIQLPLPSVL
jgi:hypothetical protein